MAIYGTCAHAGDETHTCDCDDCIEAAESRQKIKDAEYEGFKNEETFAVAFCIKNNEKLLYAIRENQLEAHHIEQKFCTWATMLSLPRLSGITFGKDLERAFKSLVETSLNSVDWEEVHRFINE